MSEASASAGSAGSQRAEETARLRLAAIDSTDSAIVICDAREPDLPIVFANAGFEAITGYSFDDVRGRNCRFLQGDDTDQPGITTLRDAVGEERSAAVELRNYRKNGEMFWSAIQISPVRNDAGGLTHFVGVLADVTERHESEQRLNTLIENLPVGIFLTDAEGDCSYANPAFCALTGLSVEAAQGSGWRQALLPEGRQDLVEDWEKSISARQGVISLSEGRLRRADGLIGWVRGSAVALKDERGRVTGYLVTLTDLTERRESERHVRESDARARAILDTVPDAIVTIDETGTIEAVNRATLDLFGYEEGELRGQNVRKLMPLPYAGEHDEYLERYRRTREAHIIGIGRDVQALRKDGVVFPIRLSIGEAQLDDGRRLYTGILQDRTESVATETRVARLGTIFEESLNEIYVFDDETLRFKEVNRGARENLGYSMEELRLLTPVDIKPEIEWGEFQAMLAPLRARSIPKVEFKAVHRRKNGSDYRVDVHLQHRSEAGEFAAIILDITEREALVEQLLQSQKMEAIGTLAGGIAHDFNNLLTSIRGSSEILADHLGEGGRLGRSIDRIQTAVDRATALTTRLLGFSRKQVTQRSTFDAAEAIREVRELIGRTLPEDIELKVDLSNEPLYVRADSSQISQVLMNLVVNAGDAMPAGGNLVLATAHEAIRDRRAETLGVAPGDYVSLRVNDTGEGIPQRTLERVFEPFFTTKEVGQGTGLGLSTAFGIIREHGGAIEVESEVGIGTTFTVLLPESKAPVAESTTGGEASVPVGASGETLLLVEDDEIMRDLLSEVLEEEGYAVLVAAEPDEALSMERAHGGGIDLVITDVVMPKMSGFLLARELRQRSPDVRVLYMSGYTDQILADRGQLRDEDPFIRKPFGNDSLLGKVREVLDARRSPSA